MDFKYGDLVIKCHQCGNEEVIEQLVEDGRALYLFNNIDNSLKLNCTKCGISMEMKIIPNIEANETAEIEEANIEQLKAEELTQDIKDEELQEEVASEEIV